MIALSLLWLPGCTTTAGAARISADVTVFHEMTDFSRDKAIDLSHQIAKGVMGLKGAVQIQGDPNDFRLEIMQILQAILREEYAMDQAVRGKIKSQKREIAESSEEWEILFKRYYQEELRKLGVAPPAQPSQQALNQRI